VVPDLPPVHRVAKADVAIAELSDAAGVAVLPCAADAKRPLTRHGLPDATTDRGQLVRWWPQAITGSATGARVVVVGSGCTASLKPLIAEDAARRQATRLRRPAVQ
jgi:hypothetical protein